MEDPLGLFGLICLQVGTLYDTKEEIFRNYPGFIGPDSTGITIKYVLNEGIDGNLAISCMDPSGAKVFAVVKHVGSNSTSGGYTLKLNSTNGLQTGIWKVLIHSDRQEIAEMEFLVLPLEVIEGHGGVKQSSQSLLAQIDKLTAQFWEAEGLCSLEDLGPDCPLINTCSKTNWSSMSPDPKSDLIFDGKGSIIK